MEIFQKRIIKKENSTLSKYWVDGVWKGYILEDKDRGLKSTMTLAELLKIKVHSQTAIPTGRFEVKLRVSPAFKRKLPWLQNVPAFEYIYAHKGNWIRDTRGCLIVGLSYGQEDGEYCVRESKKAFDPLFAEIVAALDRKEKIWWEIVEAYEDEKNPAEMLV
ncbi:DUF5675 family protein [Arundinibacter roseus]|uniref:DUF5675 domain-containing protein n=1 Tax=Arundinibacter roseus TaxID=2070510 RepID=A0A4R4K9B3_9BACT|nr:DUF5675 family protein [Arundinibacter roseus]TDB64354.1 hypothetical protein EZE20_11770 [Arundinibacter roseus]